MVEIGGDGPLGAVELTPDPSGIPVLKLTGEIDISNAETIGTELERLLGNGYNHWVVDLSGVDFMDSSGIAMLLQAATRVDSVAIRNPSDLVLRIIQATGLTDVLPLES